MLKEKVKMLQQGGADPDDVVIAKAKYQAQLQEYKSFCKDMDLTPQMERVYIDGLGRIAPGKAPYSIVNGGRSGTINQARGTGIFQSINMKTLSSKTDISIDDIKQEMNNR